MAQKLSSLAPDAFLVRLGVQGVASGLPLSYVGSEVWRVQPSRTRGWEEEDPDSHLRPVPPRDPSLGPAEVADPVIDTATWADPAALENRRAERRAELGEAEPHLCTALVELGHLAVPRAIEAQAAGHGACPTPQASDSIYGGPFSPEQFLLPHDTSGLLTVMVDDDGQCGSAFGVTLKACPELDHRQVVAGRLLRGYGALRELEMVDTRSSGTDVGRPATRILVTACGEVEDGDDGLATGADGDPFPPWPADATAMQSDRYENRLSAAAQIRGFGNDLFKAGDFQLAIAKYVKALRYLDKFWRKGDAYAREVGEREARRQARIPLLLNCAAARLKVGDARGAIDDCKAAHEEENAAQGSAGRMDGEPERFNPKAEFRLGQAHAMVHEFEAAISHFRRALLLCPNDAGITRELDKARCRMEERQRRQRKAMARALGGFGPANEGGGAEAGSNGVGAGDGAKGAARPEPTIAAAAAVVAEARAKEAEAEAEELREAYQPDSDDD